MSHRLWLVTDTSPCSCVEGYFDKEDRMITVGRLEIWRKEVKGD